MARPSVRVLESLSTAACIWTNNTPYSVHTSSHYAQTLRYYFSYNTKSTGLSMPMASN